MAKSRSSGLREYRVGFFKSFFLRRHPTGHAHCPSLIQEKVPNNEPKMAMRVSLELPRESYTTTTTTTTSTSTTWKRLFSRSKPDLTGNPPSTIPSLTNLPPNQTSNRAEKSEGAPRLPKAFSLKGNFSVKDLNKSTQKEHTCERRLTRNINNPTKSAHFSHSTSPAQLGVPKSIQYTPGKDTWENTPLFRAYSLAIKYTRLSVSTLSADVIIRNESRRKSNPICDGLTKLEPKSKYSQFEDIHEGRISRESTSHASQSRSGIHSSSHVTKAEWTQKIFVLLYSGYLLQYSGSGRFDRKPEKFLQLGKDSAAFASDAIPGKFWVLQVSQVMNPDGISPTNASSSLSRLNLRSAECRKNACSLLLVFNSGEELEAWITVLRSMIKKFRDTIESHEKIQKTLLNKPLPPPKPQCQKYMLPSLMKYPSLSFTPFGSDHAKNEDPVPHLRPEGEENLRRIHRYYSHDMIRNSYANTPSHNSFVSRGDRKLESWCSSQHRSSYMSSGQRTVMTSQFSSPNSSPTLSACDEVHSTGSVGHPILRPVSMATPEYPMSSYFLPNMAHESFRDFDPCSHEMSSPNHLTANPHVIRRSYSPRRTDAPNSSEHLSSLDNVFGNLSTSPSRNVLRQCTEVKFEPSCQSANDRAHTNKSTPPNPSEDTTKTRTLKHMSSEPCLNRSFDYSSTPLDGICRKKNSGFTSELCSQNVTPFVALPLYKSEGCLEDRSKLRIPSCSKVPYDVGLDDLMSKGHTSQVNALGIQFQTKSKNEIRSVENSPPTGHNSANGNYTISKVNHIADLSTYIPFPRIFSVPDLQQLNSNEAYEGRNQTNIVTAECPLSLPSLLITSPPLPPPKCALPPLPLDGTARKNKPKMDTI